MNRRNFLKLASTGVLASTIPASVNFAANNKKPNIIIIYHDDLNRNYVGFCGSKIPTPHMDRIAKEGAILDRFYITSPVCTPSRYSLLTGKYAGKCPALEKDQPKGSNARISWNTDFLPGEVSVAHALKDAGYTTGLTGKWHLGKPEEDLVKIDKNAAADDPKNNKLMKSNYQVCQKYVKETSGFDYVESLYISNIPSIMPTSMKYHNMEWITQGALNFIDENRDKPFFLYMSTTLPHGPHPITDSIKGDPRITPAGMLEKAPNVQPSRQSVVDRMKKHHLWNIQSGGIWADDAVGAVLEKLDKLKLANDTVIIVTSDHQADGKYTCYEGARVPCAIRWPGMIKPESKCDKLLANIDLAPTFLDIAKAKTPSGMDFDGSSFVPLMNNKNIKLRDSLLLEIAYAKAVVTDRWKYIAVRFPDKISKDITPENRKEYAQDGKRKKPSYKADKLYPAYYDDDQLYDLKADPKEQNNLAQNPQYKSKLLELKKLLKEHLKDRKHSFGEFTG